MHEGPAQAVRPVIEMLGPPGGGKTSIAKALVALAIRRREPWYHSARLMDEGRFNLPGLRARLASHLTVVPVAKKYADWVLQRQFDRHYRPRVLAEFSRDHADLVARCNILQSSVSGNDELISLWYDLFLQHHMADHAVAPTEIFVSDEGYVQRAESIFTRLGGAPDRFPDFAAGYLRDTPTPACVARVRASHALCRARMRQRRRVVPHLAAMTVAEQDRQLDRCEQMYDQIEELVAAQGATLIRLDNDEKATPRALAEEAFEPLIRALAARNVSDYTST